jgi:hypothetical protein
MLNQSLRYAPIMAMLRADPSRGPILEIGAGANGLARYVAGRPVIGIDLKFHVHPHARMSAVIGSADALPFGDRSFPLVVCSDMFEHIPPAIRRQVLHEMLRVCSGRIVLAFPAGPNALAHDQWLYRQLDRLHLRAPDWLDEHLQFELPDVTTTIAWAEASGAHVDAAGNANRVVHQWIVLAEELPPIGFATSRLISRPMPARLARAMSRGEVYRSVLTITPPAPAPV